MLSWFLQLQGHYAESDKSINQSTNTICRISEVSASRPYTPTAPIHRGSTLQFKSGSGVNVAPLRGPSGYLSG